MLAESGPYVGQRYQLIDPIGRGGMGVVFSARDRLSGQTVALKCLGLPESMDDDGSEQKTAIIPESGARTWRHISEETSLQMRMALAREFHTLSSLRHPNVISVLDFGFDLLKRPYFTMELLSSPRPLTEAAQRLPLAGKLRLLAQLLRALVYLHHRGILHRDIKPSNVLCEAEVVKVVDFGISTRKERVQNLAGTLEYMAPELLLGQDPTAASDLYSVGVLAYEMLTGRFPYSRQSVTRMLDGVLGGNTSAPFSEAARLLIAARRAALSSGGNREQTPAEHEAPEELRMEGIPDTLLGLVRGLLERQPAQRYQSAAQVLADLNKVVGAAFPIETAATRESFLQAAELVGRESQVAELSRALDRSFAGQGSAWLVGGESGVGKSRLLDELRTLALVRGARVVRGQAVSAGGAAYQVWQEALRPLCLERALSDSDAGVLLAAVPDLSSLLGRPVPEPPALDPQNAQARLFESVERLLLAPGEPAVLLLEDLHWAEPASLSLLSRLVRHLRSGAPVPVLIVGSYRDDERSTLPDELPDMQLLPLPRLTSTEITRLSASMLGDIGQRPEVVTLLERESEGNAFFMVEVARALVEEGGALAKIQVGRMPSRVMTGGVQAILARRLGRVAERARPLLCAAAVFGRELDLRVLRALPGELGESVEDHLQDCAMASVLDVSENRWRFRHDKLREALLAELTTAARTRWHHLIGEAIERSYAADLGPHAAALGYHFEQAGEPRRAIPYLLQAGEQATRSGAVHEAIVHLERAMELSKGVESTPAQHAHALGLLCRAYNGAGRSEECTQVLERMMEGAGYRVPGSSLELLADITNLISRHVRCRLGVPAHPARSDPSERAWISECVEANLAANEVFGYTRSLGRILHMNLAFLDLVERLRDPARMAPVYALTGLLLSTTPLTGLRGGYLQRAEELMAQAPQPPPAALAYMKAIQAVTHVQYGEWEQARECLSEELACRQRSGDWSQELWTLLQGACVELWHGSAASALEILARMDELVQRVDSPRYACWGRSLHGALALRSGELELAARLLREASEKKERARDLAAIVVCGGLSALAALTRGDRNQARADADAALQVLTSKTTFAYGQIFGVVALAETYFRLWMEAPDGTEKASLHKRLQRLLAELLRLGIMYPIAHSPAFLWHGRYAAARGQTRLAKWLLHKALRAAQHRRMPFDEALAHQALAAVAEARGEQI